MPTTKQIWLDTIQEYRAAPYERKRQRNLYQLCQSHGSLFLQRRYGKELSSHDVEDVLENATATFLERALHGAELADPLGYFFVVCLRKVRDLAGEHHESDETRQWQQRAAARIGTLQEKAREPEVIALLMESIGDLLRAGGSLRREQRFAYKVLPLELMSLCSAQLTKGAEAFRSIVAAESVGSPEPFFIHRDQFESSRVGLFCWSRENDFALHQSLALLDTELQALDLLLVGFKAPLSFLGSRSALISRFAPPNYLPPELRIETAGWLSDEVLAGFLGEGDHDALVQHALRVSDDNRAWLQGLLAEARFARMPLSLVARHQERAFALQAAQALLAPGQPAGDITQAAPHPVVSGLPVVLRRPPASAALEAPLFSEEEQREVTLGKLPTHDAHLSFLAEIDSPVLLVHQGEQLLVGVSFGGQTAARKTNRTWEIALGRWPRPDELIRATFQFQEGPLLEEEFCFLNALVAPELNATESPAS